jgi:hypothetical protein
VIHLPILDIRISDVISDGFYHEYQVSLATYHSLTIPHKLRIRNTFSLDKKLAGFCATFDKGVGEVKSWFDEDEMGLWLDTNGVKIGTISENDTFTLTELGTSLLTSIPYLSHENDLRGDPWS